MHTLFASLASLYNITKNISLEKYSKRSYANMAARLQRCPCLFK